MPVEAWELEETDRDRIQKYLSSPLEFPREFKKWIVDQVGMNIPPIPIEQLQGYIKTRGFADNVPGTLSTASTSFVDLGGPALAGLPDGVYLVAHGCRVGSAYGRMTISANGAAGTDADSVYVETGGSLTYSGMRIKQVTLDAGSAGNTIDTLYRNDSAGPGTVNFTFSWMAAVRVS